MDEIYTELKRLSEPLPFNQLGVPEYYRYMLSIIPRLRTLIDKLEMSYMNSLRLSESHMNEEF